MFLSAFINAVIPGDPVLVTAHDLGTALSLHWAVQDAERMCAVALMEFVRPFLEWKDFGDEATRSPW